MELLPPEHYAAMTNLYLQVASDYLVEVGGYLDECTGESLRVVFGTPLPDEKHASRACRAAIDLFLASITSIVNATPPGSGASISASESIRAK